MADFSVCCPKVLAGIDTGRVPDTIVDRSIRLAMKRKTGDEPTARFRHRHAEDEARPIRERLEAWGAAHAAELLEADPGDIPAALDDRAAEAWEPLFAIADLAGGKAPSHARGAAVALIGEEADEPGHGARLLAALRHLFADSDALATAAILGRINDDDELPFGGWNNGDGLDGRGLARLLKPYGVRPRTVRLGDATSKGYRREQFEEPWARYLPPNRMGRSQPVTPSQPASDAEPDVETILVRRFDWSISYDAEEYLRLLDTFSGHIAMKPWQRDRLYGEIRRRLRQRPDGRLDRHWGAVLHVARRTETSRRA